MKLFIPSIGQKLVLADNWSFVLYNEYRNEKFIENLAKAGLIKAPKHTSYGDAIKLGTISIPKGALLTVSRIYIRQGKSDFDSITFSVNFKLPSKKTIKGRFWAKLNDVNELHFLSDEDASKPEAITATVLPSVDFV